MKIVWYTLNTQNYEQYYQRDKTLEVAEKIYDENRLWILWTNEFPPIIDFENVFNGVYENYIKLIKDAPGSPHPKDLFRENLKLFFRLTFRANILLDYKKHPNIENYQWESLTEILLCFLGKLGDVDQFCLYLNSINQYRPYIDHAIPDLEYMFKIVEAE